jgi:hypothetical protein
MLASTQGIQYLAELCNIISHHFFHAIFSLAGPLVYALDDSVITFIKIGVKMLYISETLHQSCCVTELVIFDCLPSRWHVRSNCLPETLIKRYDAFINHHKILPCEFQCGVFSVPQVI